jgi:hypothetical protein
MPLGTQLPALRESRTQPTRVSPEHPTSMGQCHLCVPTNTVSLHSRGTSRRRSQVRAPRITKALRALRTRPHSAGIAAAFELYNLRDALDLDIGFTSIPDLSITCLPTLSSPLVDSRTPTADCRHHRCVQPRCTVRRLRRRCDRDRGNSGARSPPLADCHSPCQS